MTDDETRAEEPTIKPLTCAHKGCDNAPAVAGGYFCEAHRPHIPTPPPGPPFSTPFGLKLDGTPRLSWADGMENATIAEATIVRAPAPPAAPGGVSLDEPWMELVASVRAYHHRSDTVTKARAYYDAAVLASARGTVDAGHADGSVERADIVYARGFKAGQAEAQGEVERLTAERDAARADVASAQETIAELHTFPGLIASLDEHFPEDIFPMLPDDERRDPGPRTVSLLRTLAAERSAHSELRARMPPDSPTHGPWVHGNALAAVRAERDAAKAEADEFHDALAKEREAHAATRAESAMRKTLWTNAELAAATMSAACDEARAEIARLTAATGGYADGTTERADIVYARGFKAGQAEVQGEVERLTKERDEVRALLRIAKDERPVPDDGEMYATHAPGSIMLAENDRLRAEVARITAEPRINADDAARLIRERDSLRAKLAEAEALNDEACDERDASLEERKALRAKLAALVAVATQTCARSGEADDGDEWVHARGLGALRAALDEARRV